MEGKGRGRRRQGVTVEEPAASEPVPKQFIHSIGRKKCSYHRTNDPFTIPGAWAANNMNYTAEPVNPLVNLKALRKKARQLTKAYTTKRHLPQPPKVNKVVNSETSNVEASPLHTVPLITKLPGLPVALLAKTLKPPMPPRDEYSPYMLRCHNGNINFDYFQRVVLKREY